MNSLFKYIQKKFALKGDREFIITKKIALAYFAVAFPYLFIFSFFNEPLLSLSTIPFLILFFLPIAIQNKKHEAISKFNLIITSNLALIFYSFSLGKEAGIYLIFFALIVTPFVIFKETENKKTNATIIITITSYFISEFICILYKPIFVIHQWQYTTIFSTMALFSFTIIILSTKAFKKEYTNSEKKLKLALKEAKERKLMLEKASQQNAFATLTRGIAHEVKNPMAMILSGIELIIDNIDNKNETLKFAELVKENILRLKNITTTMLKYGSTVNKNYSDIDINHIIRDACLVSEAECKKRRIKIITNLTAKLPLIKSHPDSIHQILLNIILNSIQALDSDGEIAISTKLVRDSHPLSGKEAIQISIQDNGPGILREKLENIFDPFYSTKYGNIGLGLSIVLKTINELNGHIEVNSEQNKYTEFKIHLPVK